MPALAPLQIRDKVELALRAYLQSRIAALAGNALVSPRTVALSLRKEVTTKILPRVVISCPRGQAREEAAQLYDIEAVVFVGASAFECRDVGAREADITALHAARVGLLTEWLADTAAILAFANEPASPTPDTRTVKGLRIEDIWPEDEAGDQVDNHFMDQLTYTVVAQLQDEAN